jgi:hypothetical protein
MTNFALDKMMTSFDVGYKIYEECRALIRAYDASSGDRDLLGDIDDKAISLGEIREELRVMGEKVSGSNAAEYRRMMAQVSAWHKEILPYGELKGMKG